MQNIYRYKNKVKQVFDSLHKKHNMCSISRTLLFTVFFYFHLPVSPMRVQSVILSNRLRPRRPWQTCECLQVQKARTSFSLHAWFSKKGLKSVRYVLVRGSLTNYRHPFQIEQFLRESRTSSSRLEPPDSSSVSRRRSSRRRLGPATKDGFVFLATTEGFFKGRDSFFKIKMCSQ